MMMAIFYGRNTQLFLCNKQNNSLETECTVLWLCWAPSGHELSRHNIICKNGADGCEWSLERQVISVSVCLG